jgi:hypothetical protein
MATEPSHNTRLIKHQRQIFLVSGYVSGLVAILSYVPSFLHGGSLRVEPHTASRIRLWGLLVALFIMSGTFLCVAFAELSKGRVVTENRIIYRQSHRIEYLARLSISVLMALLAPALLIALLLSGVHLV